MNPNASRQRRLQPLTSRGAAQLVFSLPASKSPTSALRLTTGIKPTGVTESLTYVTPMPSLRHLEASRGVARADISIRLLEATASSFPILMQTANSHARTLSRRGACPEPLTTATVPAQYSLCACQPQSLRQMPTYAPGSDYPAQHAVPFSQSLDSSIAMLCLGNPRLFRPFYPSTPSANNVNPTIRIRTAPGAPVPRRMIDARPFRVSLPSKRVDFQSRRPPEQRRLSEQRGLPEGLQVA